MKLKITFAVFSKTLSMILEWCMVAEHYFMAWKMEMKLLQKHFRNIMNLESPLHLAIQLLATGVLLGHYQTFFNQHSRTLNTLKVYTDTTLLRICKRRIDFKDSY